jgi:hypothetical protein
MSDYLTTDELRAWIGSDTTNFEGAAQAACTVASRAVEKMCSRYFYADSARQRTLLRTRRLLHRLR